MCFVYNDINYRFNKFSGFIELRLFVCHRSEEIYYYSLVFGPCEPSRLRSDEISDVAAQETIEIPC